MNSDVSSDLDFEFNVKQYVEVFKCDNLWNDLNVIFRFFTRDWDNGNFCTDLKIEVDKVLWINLVTLSINYKVILKCVCFDDQHLDTE